MDVGIIGAGSIGMLIGSYIAESGLDVTMLVRRKRQQEKLKEKGIYRINEAGTRVVMPVHATTAYTEIAQAKLIIIAVKYKDLASVLAQLKHENIQAPILFIQNGIGHLHGISEKTFPKAAFATVEHGALKQNDYTVNHNGIGNITIGVAFGEKEAFQLLKNIDLPQFPIRWHADVEQLLLRKTLINCLINPLTTILEVSNGDLLTNPHSLQLMKNLYDELMEVFPNMHKELPFTAIENVCKKTAANESSMLTDYREGRPMEIDTIVSAVIQKAGAEGKPLPLLQTYEQLLLVLDRKAGSK